MSVEKMKIVGVVGKKNLLSRVLRLVVLNGRVHMINALVRVNSSDFFLPPSEKNIEVLEELPFLKPCSSKKDFTKDEEVVKSLLSLFDIKPQVRKEYLGQDYNYDDFMKQLSDIYDRVHSTADEIEEKMRSINKKREYIDSLKYLSSFDFDIGQLICIKHLAFRLIKISRENYDKLKKNYENIPAVVLKMAVEGKYVILVSITPVSLEETLEKIFRSLNYVLLPLPTEFTGTAAEIIEKLDSSIKEEQKDIESLKESLETYKREYIGELKKGYSRLKMEKKIEELKSDMARGDKLFFMFGFVPINSVAKLQNELKTQFGDNVVIMSDDIKKDDSGITPPTKLSNSKFFKPFEMLVKMYGTPAYHEKDPTTFFALTYMLLFGAMFGDVGQGFLLLFVGLFLEIILRKSSIGGILSRIGLSSAIFGFIYGSVFGSEEIISPFILRPMENINYILLAGVIFGVIIILGAFIYNVINSAIEKNIERGLFSRNGLAGIAFYLILLYTVFRVFVIHSSISPALVCIMIGLLFLMVFKQPLTNKLTHADKLYRESPANYYIEEGFGVVETLLSMLSNTISFLRVGAFALNHVGLYIAFATMARMMTTSWGSLAILVLGNIIIIGLEGLIVFIQALRLEYYELFTKYFRGDGIEYVPVKIKIMSSINRKISLFHKKDIFSNLGNIYPYNIINLKRGF
ncbi:MAG: V-type ATPase 116kDa subunit family protein [Candidatus Caldatribacteriota bacterium]|nr:V-type ATPase 116kDa subunit family protein [Candidatus Caldatribacteriota bacterium]